MNGGRGLCQSKSITLKVSWIMRLSYGGTANVSMCWWDIAIGPVFCMPSAFPSETEVIDSISKPIHQERAYEQIYNAIENWSESFFY